MSADHEDLVIKIALEGAARAAAEMRLVKKETKAVGDSTERAGRKARKAGEDYSIFGGVLRQLGIAGAIAGVGLLAKVIGAGGAGAIGLVAALAPLAGVLGALPALGLLAGQGLGVAMFALQGVRKAVGGLNAQMNPKKFAALSRPAQNFALVLDALKPRVRSLQTAVGNGLFPGLTKGLLAAAPALTTLHGPLTQTGVVLGLFAAHLGALVGSKGFLTDLSSQAKFNNVQLGRLGGAGIHVVNMLRNLTVGSRGLVSWLVKLAGGWAASGDKMVSNARRTGALQDGFHTIQVTLSRVGRLVWALGHAFFNIGRIGKQQIGDGILVYLLRGALALERWTSSARGITTITRTFDSARSTLHKVADTLDRLKASAGPGAGDAIRNIVSAFTPLLASGGSVTVLSVYVQALSQLGAVVGWLAHNVPGASFAMSAFLALFLLNKITNVGLLAKGVGLLGKAIVVTAAQTRAGATAFWALNSSLVATRARLAGLFSGLGGRARAGGAAAGAQFGAAASSTAAARIRGFAWKGLGAAIGLTIGVEISHSLAKGGVNPSVSPKQYGGGFFGKVLSRLNDVGNLPINFYAKVLGIHPKQPKHKPGAHALGGIVRSPLQLVGERGPELAALPIGSRVFTAGQTAHMLRPVEQVFPAMRSVAMLHQAAHLASPVGAQAFPTMRPASPVGAQVFPGAPTIATLRAPRTAAVHRSSDVDGSDSRGRPIHLHSTTTLTVDGRVLAKVVNDETARQHGRDR